MGPPFLGCLVWNLILFFVFVVSLLFVVILTGGLVPNFIATPSTLYDVAWSMLLPVESLFCHSQVIFIVALMWLLSWCVCGRKWAQDPSNPPSFRTLPISSIFLLRFSIFPFVSRVFVFAYWNICVIMVLMSLSGYSNTCYFSVGICWFFSAGGQPS